MKLFFVFVMSFISYSVKADTTDNYQIYIKKVLVCNDGGLHYPWNKNNFLQLEKAIYSDTIDINFNHCTSGGKNRRITLVSSKNKIVTEWKFPDKDIERLMRIPIQKIVRQEQIEANVSFDLYYYDDQEKQGRFLMSVQIADKS